jgi:hypothetical protein
MGWLCEEFKVTIAKQTLSRELRAMGIASWTPSVIERECVN